MPTVVELTSDEAKLLAGLQRVIQKEIDHERQLARTAAAGNAAGDELEAAMARVKKSNDDALKGLLGDLRKAGPEGQALGTQLQKHFSATGQAGQKSIDAVIAELRKVDPAAAAAAEAMREEFAANQVQLQFDDSIRSIERLGGTAAKVVNELREELAAIDLKPPNVDAYVARLRELDPAVAAVAERIETEFQTLDPNVRFEKIQAAIAELGPEAAALSDKITRELATAGTNSNGLQTYLANLEKLGPAGAAAAEQIRTKLAAADQQSSFDATLAQLRALGGDAKAIADGIAADLAAADATAAGDMNEVLERLKSIDPTVAASAERIKTELGEAARFSEGKFGDTLSELRRMGPVGKQVADELKTNLVKAGELSEKSIDDVIAKIHAIDPAAAAAARSIHKNIDAQTKASSGSFESFSKSAISQITAVAGAYVGIQEGIQLVTTYLHEQEEVLKSSLEKQISLAKAQQEAAKNLAGLSTVQRDELLQKAVPEIARDTGFSDVSQITNAIGAAVSRGASSEQAAEAVRQSARVEINTPDNLDETAGGAVALQIQTGLKDVREAIALIQTTGTQSAIVDPAKLIEALPKAVGASVATVREQDVNEAARQSAALFAQITQGGNDEKGTSSATFQIDLTARLDKFFTGFQDELINARSKIELIDRKIAKGSDTEANRRDREQLQEFVKTGEQVQKDLSGTQAFKTLGGRLETLQQFKPLAQQFVGPVGFGEKQFQTVLKDLLDANSDRAKGFTQSSQIIQASPEFFEQQAAAIASGTPQLALANFQNRSAAGQSSQLSYDNEGAALVAIREAVATTLAETRTSGVTGFLSAQVDETGIRSGATSGGTTAEESIGLINTLLGRRKAFEADGITVQEQPKVERLDQQIQAIRQLIEVNAKTLAPGSIDAASGQAAELARKFLSDGGVEQAKYFADLSADFRRVAEAIEKQNAIAERGAVASETTAANTKPQPGSPSRAVAGSAARSNARNAP